MNKIAILSMLFILLIPQSVFAKDPFHSEFINVEIDMQENGDLVIKETHQYVFDAPYSARRFRWISLNGLGSIADISVTEDGKPLNINTYIESNRQWINWTKAVNPPDRHTFVLSYRVIGRPAIYKDGDQLHWQAIFKDHAVPINKAKVTVKLPAILAGHIQAYQGAIARKLNDQTVEFINEHPLPAGQGLDISMTFSREILNVSTAQQQVTGSEENPDPEASWVDVINCLIFIALLVSFFSYIKNYSYLHKYDVNRRGYGADWGDGGGDGGGGGGDGGG